MDPITLGLLGSAVIGGGSSLIGGMMNTSSQQAINAASLQYSQAQASGQFLPQYYQHLVSGAQGAGLNPLAVLGVNNPSAPLQLESGRPGAAVQGAGAAVSDALRAASQERINDATLRKIEVDIANGRTMGNNAAIQGERMRILNSQMEGYIARHPYAIPEGLQYPTTTDALEELRSLGEGVSSGPSVWKWANDRINEGFSALGGR